MIIALVNQTHLGPVVGSLVFREKTKQEISHITTKMVLTWDMVTSRPTPLGMLLGLVLLLWPQFIPIHFPMIRRRQLYDTSIFRGKQLG